MAKARAQARLAFRDAMNSLLPVAGIQKYQTRTPPTDKALKPHHDQLKVTGPMWNTCEAL